MKFHWFAQQYYTDLPGDYADTIRSGWVTAPIRVADPAQIGRDYHMYLRLMQGADRLGWDSLLLNEHHQTTLAMTPSPNLIASILAATTENVGHRPLRELFGPVQPTGARGRGDRHARLPVGGRIIAGIVFGTPMDTAFSYGVPPIELRDRFHEARELIHRAWKSDEPFAFNGKYTKLRYVNPWPRPIQEELPVWIPGFRQLETWDVVNDLGYCYGYLSFRGKKSATPVVNGFWERTEEVGAELNPHRMAFTQIICCADSDAEAERLYGDAVKYFSP